VPSIGPEPDRVAPDQQRCWIICILVECPLWCRDGAPRRPFGDLLDPVHRSHGDHHHRPETS